MQDVQIYIYTHSSTLSGVSVSSCGMFSRRRRRRSKFDGKRGRRRATLAQNFHSYSHTVMTHPSTSHQRAPTHMCQWTHTSFPVALVLISRSICTRQEIMTSLTHINMSLLAFSQCLRVPVRVLSVLVCVCVFRERELWMGMKREYGFFNYHSLSQSVTEVRVCVSQHIHLHISQDIPLQKVFVNYTHYLYV